MSDTVIYNGRIFNGVEFVNEYGLYVKNGEIQNFLTEAEVMNYRKENVTLIDASGNVIMPGMIDLQLNGCGGVLFNDEQSVEVLRTMNKTNIKYGCTGFVATLVTSDDEKIESGIECTKIALDQNIEGVLGIHLEGPMISIEKKGIHQPKFMRTLSPKMQEKLIEYKEYIKMITIAPECVEDDVLKTLSDAGLALSIGHSNGMYEDCAKKGKYFTHATHLWNAMRPLGSRDPGVVGYVLDNSHLFTGIIADGIHVHPANIHLAATILKDTLYVTTDAVTPAGREDIKSFLLEGNTVYVQDDKACRNKEGNLGGANITMSESVEYLVETSKITLEQALKMATSTPANAIGEGNRRGYIKENYIADITILNTNDWKIQYTLQNGQIVYKK